MIAETGELGKCVVKVPCEECDGNGGFEPFNPYEGERLCFWCDGTKVAEFEEVYDTYEDALADYPDAVEIIKLRQASGRFDAFVGLQEKPE